MSKQLKEGIALARKRVIIHPFIKKILDDFFIYVHNYGHSVNRTVGRQDPTSVTTDSIEYYKLDNEFYRIKVRSSWVDEIEIDKYFITDDQYRPTSTPYFYIDVDLHSKPKEILLNNDKNKVRALDGLKLLRRISKGEGKPVQYIDIVKHFYPKDYESEPVKEGIRLAPNKFTAAETWYDTQREKILHAKSTNEMIDIMTAGPYNGIPEDKLIDYINSERKRLRKEINTKFRGNLEKSRDYFTRLLNRNEHTFFDASMDEGISIAPSKESLIPNFNKFNDKLKLTLFVIDFFKEKTGHYIILSYYKDEKNIKNYIILRFDSKSLEYIHIYGNENMKRNLDYFNKMKKDHMKTNEAKIEDVPGMSSDYLKNIKGRAEAKYGRTEGMQDIRRVSQLLMQILEIQDGYEEELTDVGLELINKYYGTILDDVKLKASIVKPGDVEQEQMFKKAFEKPEKSFASKGENVESENLPEEVHKRKLINNIMQGEGQNVHSMMHEVKDVLDNIDPQLLPLYDEFLKVTLRLYWWDNSMLKQMISAGKTNMLEVGWEKPDKAPDTSDMIEDLEEGKPIDELEEEGSWGAGKPYIKVKALILPLLIHETVKGIYDLIASASYLEDKEKEEIVQDKTSSIEDELEDIKHGQGIAEDLRNMINSIQGIEKHPNIREFIFGKMVIMPAKEFIELINGITENSPKAKAKLEQLAKEVIKELETETYVEPVKDVEVKKEKAKQKQGDYIDFTKMDPKEIDKMLKYKQQGEIDFLLNKALDKEDYDNAKIISNYIKEDLDEAYDDVMTPAITYEEYIDEIKQILAHKYNMLPSDINKIINYYDDHIYNTYHESEKYYSPEIIVKSFMLKNTRN